MKAKVSERALIARINRRLAKENEKLIVCEETSPSFTDLGRYYVVDLNQNIIGSSNLDLEQVGRDTKALKGYEVLEDADQGETITAKFADLPDKDTVQDAEPVLEVQEIDKALEQNTIAREIILKRIKAEKDQAKIDKNSKVTWEYLADKLNAEGETNADGDPWTKASLPTAITRMEKKGGAV